MSKIREVKVKIDQRDLNRVLKGEICCLEAHVTSVTLPENHAVVATLSFPYEPEVLHLDYDFTLSGSDERHVNWLPLLGKRWKIVATEVCE